MARRHANPTRESAATVDPDTRQRKIERLMEAGNAKEAFKQAKFYFHQDASAENRRLVERTYLLRIQSLIRGGMPSAGREVAGSLLEFGVTDPSLMQELILLLPRVGLADKALALQGRVGTPETRAELVTGLVDRAVVHPEETLASMPELRDAVGLVRAALAALDADNESLALESLQLVPRGSPVADWRYFVRGLVAYRRNDLAQAQANWDRLNPQRAARKIAVQLLAMLSPETNRDRTDQFTALEVVVYGEPVLEKVGELRRALEAADWKRMLQLVGPLRRILRGIDPRHAQRLTDILLPPLSAEIMQQSFGTAQGLLRDFMAALEPLPWDPHFNRFQALLWEGPQGGPNDAAGFWRKYLQDLDQGATAPFGEVRQVKALVWRRIGKIAADQADDEDDDEFDEDDYEEFERPDDEVDASRSAFRDQALEALRESLRLDSTQRGTHDLLIDILDYWEQSEPLLAALEGLHAAFPEDVDALRRLIVQYQRRDEPEPVLVHVKRLRALRPLDTASNELEVWARLAHARQLALQKRWDEGRAELVRGAALPEEGQPDYHLLTRRAVFEFKAGEAARAEEYIERARGSAKAPAMMWLSLAIEAARYKLSKLLQKRFSQELKTALAGKRTSAAAGGIAELIGGYLTSEVEYVGRAGHVQQVVRYLRGTTRLKYELDDLRRVCALLQVLEEATLLATLVRRGQTLFRKSPFFLLLDATLTLNHDVTVRNLYIAREKLGKALALAQASQDPHDATLIPVIRDSLTRVEDLDQVMDTMPFPRGAMPGSPSEFQKMFNEFMDHMAGVGPEDDADERETDWFRQGFKPKPR